MKTIIQGLHKAFDSRVRLGIMAVLSVNDTLDFTALKDYLNLTDGNLASHLKALEKEKFIGVKKTFVDRKPNTRYFITNAGRNAFQNHIDALEELINTQK